MIDFERVKDTWFNKFFQLLTENCRLEDVPGRLSSVKIISFNYDRCIAHYIYFALQNYFGVDHNQAAELLSNLEIFHPYGKVGELPWQNDGTDSTEFGAEIPSQKLLTISTQIRTFTEGTNPETSNIKALRQSIVDSNTLIFLGFAYHRLNLNLLKSQQTSGAPRSAYGTAYGLSVPNCEEIKYEVTNLVGKAIGNPQIKNNLKCGQLFDEYSRVMSMV